MSLRLGQLVRYRLDRLIADGARGKLIVLLAISGGLLLLGAAAGLVGLFAERNRDVAGVTRDLDGGVLDALWWSFHHLLDPSFFAENYGASWPVLLLSLAVALGGMVAFGLLVGFVSSEVEERLDALRRGDGPVLEHGHALVLGWNERAPAVVAMLASRGTVAVLAPRAADDMRQALVEAGLGARLRRAVLRSGRPDRAEDLVRAGVARARCCIVLPEDGDDAAVARTLLVCGRRPRLVAEAAAAANADTLGLIGGGQTPVLAAARVVSSLLFQASRQRHVAAVQQAVLDPEGIGFRFVHVPALAGLPFGEAAFAFPEAVLCGISAAERLSYGGERYLVRLNPPWRRAIAEGEWLVVLAPPGPVRDRCREPAWAAEALRIRADAAAGRDSALALPPPPRPAAPTRHSVLIVGWNDAVPDLLAAYDGCRGQPAEIAVAAGCDQAEAQARLAARGVALRRIRLAFVAGGLDDPAVIRPERYACVLVLRDPEAGGDAATMLGLVRLRAHLRQQRAEARLVVELGDGGAVEAVRALGVEDVIVGPETVARHLVLIAEQASLAGVVADLLDANGSEIYLKPVSRYLRQGATATFTDLSAAAFRLGEVALGLRRADGRLELAPPKDRVLGCGEGDQVVVLAEDLLDEE